MNAKRKGFTLVELILVMGILVLLMTLLLPEIPALVNVYKVRMSEWLMATLTAGIEQYKMVYHDYPHDLVRMSNDNTKLLNSITNTGGWTDPGVCHYGNTQGSHSLFLALQGPDGTGWHPLPTDATKRRILDFGPYPESPKWVGVPGAGQPGWAGASQRRFEDPFGKPVLYYQARPGNTADINISTFILNTRYIFLVNQNAWKDGESQRGANEGACWPYPYIFQDGGTASYVHWMLGLTKSTDKAGNHYPYNDKSYVLWMAGADEKFGYWIWSEEHKGFIPDPDPTSEIDGVKGVCDDIRSYTP
jgi:prepilin-type N-terminal cleavage/methylation domain-containing protein